jgi:carbamoyltransferase
MGHAISAFCLSGFSEAALLVIDGMGSPVEDLSADEAQRLKTPVKSGAECISLYMMQQNSLSTLEKHLVAGGEWLTKRGNCMSSFRTLGGMYSAVARQIFGDAMEAGKVMGLAPYGHPAIPCEEFFSIQEGLFYFHDKVPVQFDHNRRWPDLALIYKNLASSTQKALEVGVLYLVEHSFELSGCANLCYAGGVALNGIANERIIAESQFRNVFIPPAAEDSGVAVGAAYYGLWQLTGQWFSCESVNDSVGTRYSQTQIRNVVRQIPVIESKRTTDLLDVTVDLLCDGKAVGWHQGGSELGPRALGQRSILCDPRMEHGKDMLNRGVKFRESFRPFAPVVLFEYVNEWFTFEKPVLSSPFMLRVCDFHEQVRRLVPAVVHVDGTGRLQTVTPEGNSLLYNLLRKFYEKTSIPMLLNTSFNIAGEPLVETPEDAIWCFLATSLDACVVGPYLITKRPGFRSILDLRPEITASFGESLACGSQELRNAVINTLWGKATQNVPEQFIPVLSLINGVRDGWELLRRLNEHVPISEARCVCLLARMRRARLIKFLFQT